jgi:hypothetical protein
MLHSYQCLCFWWRTFVYVADVLINLGFFYTFFSENSLHNELLNVMKIFCSWSFVICTVKYLFVPVYISHFSPSVAKNNIEKKHIYT